MRLVALSTALVAALAGSPAMSSDEEPWNWGTVESGGEYRPQITVDNKCDAAQLVTVTTTPVGFMRHGGAKNNADGVPGRTTDFVDEFAAGVLSGEALGEYETAQVTVHHDASISLDGLRVCLANELQFRIHLRSGSDPWHKKGGPQPLYSPLFALVQVARDPKTGTLIMPDPKQPKTADPAPADGGGGGGGDKPPRKGGVKKAAWIGGAGAGILGGVLVLGGGGGSDNGTPTSSGAAAPGRR